jgi:hypothetical protein
MQQPGKSLKANINLHDNWASWAAFILKHMPIVSSTLSLIEQTPNIILLFTPMDRLCGLAVRVPDYTARGSGSIPGATSFFFLVVVDLERGPLSLVTTIELLGRKSRGSGLETRDYGRRGSSADYATPSKRKSWH